MRNWRLFMAALSCAALSATGPANAASPIGNTVQASTKVSASGRVLQKASPLFFNDVLRTNATGIGQFTFNDGARLAIGPSASVTIDKSIYKGDKSIQQASIQASKGAFRYISGAFSGHKINTPYGTIGIRGTAFDFTIRNGRVYILLFRGAVSFCKGGGCKTLKAGCDYIVASGGKISNPQPLSAGVDSGLNVGEVFPLLANESRLNSRFRQGSGSCLSRAATRLPTRQERTRAATVAPAAEPASEPPGSPRSGKTPREIGNPNKGPIRDNENGQGKGGGNGT